MTNHEETKKEAITSDIQSVNERTTVVDITLEEINSFKDVIKRIHAEADFAAKSFDGKSAEFSATLNKLLSNFQDQVKKYSFLISSHEKQIEINQEGLSTLTLIPDKLQNRIENIAPQFAVEVEKIHSARMEAIITHIKQTEQELKDNIWESQKLIEGTTEESIRKIEEIQLIALESNKKQIADFARFVRKEVEAITSNHGGKFLRNLIITILLSAIAGGLTSWSVGTYFPRLIHIDRTGDITVKDSAVKIMEGNNPKINESNQKIKVTK